MEFEHKLTVLETVGFRPTISAIQFITLSVQLCVQHDARDAARRAGPSATAAACFISIVAARCVYSSDKSVDENNKKRRSRS